MCLACRFQMNNGKTEICEYKTTGFFGKCQADKLASLNYCHNHVYCEYYSFDAENSICLVRGCKNKGSTRLYYRMPTYIDSMYTHITDLCDAHQIVYSKTKLSRAFDPITSKINFTICYAAAKNNIKRYLNDL